MTYLAIGFLIDLLDRTGCGCPLAIGRLLLNIFSTFWAVLLVELLDVILDLGFLLNVLDLSLFLLKFFFLLLKVDLLL